MTQYLCQVPSCFYLAEAVLPCSHGLFYVCEMHDADQVRGLLDEGVNFMSCIAGGCGRPIVLPCVGAFVYQRTEVTSETWHRGYSGTARSQTRSDGSGGSGHAHPRFDMQEPWEPSEGAWLRHRRRR